MATPYLPTPAEVALMTALLVRRYEKERGKPVTRFRMARRSVRRMAIRTKLREAFVDEWIDVLAETHGWAAFEHGDEFLLLRVSTKDQWTRLGTSRLNDLVKPMRKGDRSPLDGAEDEIGPPADDGDDDD